MSDTKYQSDTGRAIVINDDASLATGVRAAADYNNDTARDLWGIAILTVQFDTTAPSAGTSIADLYIIPGDGAGTELYAEGGDAGLGTDDTPQAVWYAGSFQTINPSTSVDESLSIPVRLYADGNRFVLVNTSGQTFDLTWHLDIKPWKYQNTA